MISRADIFDQSENPFGTQRNLSPGHAKKAYQYVTTRTKAFYPEVVFNIRDPSYVKFIENGKGNERTFGTLEFLKDPVASKDIVVSRLDGNHRLWFVDGHDSSMPAVDRVASFCFLITKDLRQEVEVFRDINDNQMGMNTSHLHNIAARLLGEKVLKVTNPSLYIVQQLQKDKSSPLHHRIYEGGRVEKGVTLTGLTIANLTSSVKDMVTRSAKLSQFPDTDAQYEVIKNFWSAVCKWLPDAWEDPSKYIIFKGVGLYAISYVGVEVIDRCLLKGKYQVADLLTYLKRIPSNALLRSKETLVYAGRGGGRKLANDLLADLEEEGEISVSKLQKMILGEE
jgi:DGQHR domain-containing protein